MMDNHLNLFHSIAKKTPHYFWSYPRAQTPQLNNVPRVQREIEGAEDISSGGFG